MSRTMFRRREDGLDVYAWKEGPDHWPLVRACMRDGFAQRDVGNGTFEIAGTGAPVGVRTLKYSPKRSVYRLDAGGESFVLKRAALSTLGLKYLFPNVMGLTASTNVMRRVGAAVDKGCRGLQETLLVAERRTSLFAVEAWILLRYVPGEALRPEELRARPERVTAVFEEMLRHGVTTNDLGLRNIIDSGDGLSVIDIGCRSCYRLEKAKMLRKLELKHGLTIPARGIADFLFGLVAKISIKEKRYANRRT